MEVGEWKGDKTFLTLGPCRGHELNMSNKDDLMGSLMVSGSSCLMDSTQTVKTQRGGADGRSVGSRGGSARGAVIADVTTQSDLSSGIREAPSASTSGSSQLSDYEVQYMHACPS